jgi:hypothetical protein
MKDMFLKNFNWRYRIKNRNDKYVLFPSLVESKVNKSVS